MDLDPDDPRLGLRGVAELRRDDDGWWTPFRIPEPLRRQLHPEVELRARMTPGALFAFRSDATRVDLEVDVGAPGSGRAAVTPFDVLVDGELVLRHEPDRDGTLLSVGDLTPGQDVEVWLPQYGMTRIGRVHADATTITALEPDGPRWLLYGSSISQCRLSVGPSETWPALVARSRDWSLENLAMSGECHLDPPVAQYLRDRPAELIMICAGINIYNAASFTARTLGPALGGFLATIRQGHPRTPLAVMTSIASPARETTPNAAGLTLAGIRTIVGEWARRTSGDIVVIDGLDILGADDSDLLVDGLHPGDAGYRLMAERLGPRLESLIGRRG